MRLIPTVRLLGRGLRALALTGALAILPGLGASDPAAAAKPPVCRGKNMLDEMRVSAPETHARVMREAAAMPNGEALLWKIARKGTPPSWLFGTIHMTDARVHALPASLTRAFDAADTLALEATDLDRMDSPGGLDDLRGFFLQPPGKSRLMARLSKGERAHLARVLAVQLGMPRQVLSVMRPWFLSMLLAIAPCEQKRQAMGLKSLDGHLEAMARRAGKRLVGLESVEEQFRIMASLPADVELAWLRSSLALYDRIDDMTETMVQLYLARQIKAVLPFSIALGEKVGLTRQILRAFQRILITERNHRMAKRAAPLLARGGAFIAVGALHLPGDEGLVALLREARWQVTAVE